MFRGRAMKYFTRKLITRLNTRYIFDEIMLTLVPPHVDEEEIQHKKEELFITRVIQVQF